MPTIWSCDACGCQLTALSACLKSYGVCNYKTLCGDCARRMDKAALKVFRDIRAGTPARRGLLARWRELFG